MADNARRSSWADGRSLAGCGLAALLCIAPGLARADNSGAADAELEIGAIATYGSQEAARRHCGRDAVVWADRYAGYVYFAREPQYGRTEQGAFACLHEALESNYWTTGPLSSMAKGHGPGRVFPFTPIPDTHFTGS